MSKNLPVQTTSQFVELFEGQSESLAALLPRGVELPFMKANFLAAMAANPKLLQCTRSSIMRSVFEACELGLMVHSSLGEAWIVPYKNQATFIPGYQGLTKLAYNAGFVKRIESRPVFSNDDFSCVYGINPVLRLREASGSRGALLGVYCLVELNTGGVLFDYWPLEKLEHIRSKSAAWRFKGMDHEIWGDEHNTLEMYRKAVWRNVSKWIPRSGTRYTRALDIDAREYEDNPYQEEDAEMALYRAVGVEVDSPEIELSEASGTLENQAKVFSNTVSGEPIEHSYTDDAEEEVIDKSLSDEFPLEALAAELKAVFGKEYDDDPDVWESVRRMAAAQTRGGNNPNLPIIGGLEDMSGKQVKQCLKLISRLRNTHKYNTDVMYDYFIYVVTENGIINTTRSLDDWCKAYNQMEKEA